ncbi:hypothetical protein NIES2119_08095 [[Phormidium ambiguum] IAM M-71]|uniref:DUF2778 domain-containing protein n=1 Tax=[Phormidium ambiguum] IAM M-71 TaxID=454136 RepID=A0A1U7IP03_9CYAN|nr:hypothetical protein [Phormidium ambiguum]OKH39081.1 hypothetical protein NIES2119_08095 [Phormidium ambiguum IAM M-71]
MLQLKFFMDLKSSSNLILGQLSLYYPNGERIDFTATSGCRGWQSHENIWKRGRGPIPPDFNYSVPTVGYHSETAGIDGEFFHIWPDPVKSDSGVTRGEFGIHRDANFDTSPGSAGCIVLTKDFGWQRFCERMHALKSDFNLDRIPLHIDYR